MKLNPDSIRAVLLYLEENLKFGEKISSQKVAKDILDAHGMTKGYEEDILYAIKQLKDDF